MGYFPVKPSEPSQYNCVKRERERAWGCGGGDSHGNNITCSISTGKD